MTLQEGLSFAVLGGAVIVFAWGRFRYDLAALFALLVGVSVGIVKPKEAFTGFTSDVVVIIACALVVSAAIARSGVMEWALRPLLSRLKTARTQVPAMAGATALLSMPTKNVGALAIMMPLALRLARRSETSPSSILMPMSFMSLLGGLVTLVGTSTNIIASQVRQEILGHPFKMFDFAPVGLVLTAIAWVFVSFAWRILPTDRKGQAGLGEAVAGAPYSTEVVVPGRKVGDDGAKPEPLTLSDLKLGQDDVKLAALIRRGKRRSTPLPDAPLNPGDILVLEGDQESLDAVISRTSLVNPRAELGTDKDQPSEEMRSVEGVLQRESVLAGQSARRLQLQQQYGVNLLAVGRKGERITERLREVTLQPGDVVVLQAGEKALPDAMRELGVLPLAERDVRLGGSRVRWLPAAILAGAMILLAFGLIPVAIAFFGAAILVVATRGLSMREAYDSLDGQVLVLIGALTPLSEAVRHSGGTDLIAHLLADGLHAAPPILALGLLMIVAMGCSPFLHNAPTVLVLAPISVSLARALHLNPDAFLMAVATGAGCDFLTPIGHQSNTLVMGPGGYRFGDYWKLGAPLSILVIVVGTPLIALVWHIGAH